MTKKVLLIDTLHPSFSKQLEHAGIQITEGYDWTREKVLEEIHQYQGIAIRSRFRIDADFIARSTHLTCIGRAGAGMENIDVIAAKNAGIISLNAPEGNRDAVAEHAMGMLLMLTNHLRRADSEVRKGIWKREENRGTEIAGKTIGIIGFGNMGSAFAKRLQGFGMSILAYDPYIKIDTADYPYVNQCNEDLIFGECDIVSLHVPLTDETTFFVSDKWLGRFKKNIWFINTARGKNVDTASLVRSLHTGKVLGAALDVFEYEDLSFENIGKGALPEAFHHLVIADNVVLSPHIAGWTHESNQKIANTLATKMIKALLP